MSTPNSGFHQGKFAGIAVLTTGSPVAKASRTTNPKVSWVVGCKKRSDVRIKFPISWGDSAPVQRTQDSSPRSRANFSSAGRRAPSPTWVQKIATSGRWERYQARASKIHSTRLMAALPGIKLATDSQCQTVGSLEAAASSAPNARWAYGAKSTTLGTTTTFLMPCARKSFAKCSDTAKTRWAPSYARRSRAPKSGWSNQLCALDQCSVTTYGTPHRRARTRASTPPGKPMFP